MSTVAAARTSRTNLSVLAAAVVSGTTGYVVLVVAARVLDLRENAQFLVYWGGLFAVFGVLIGITTETTRAIVAGRGSVGTGARVLPVSLGVGLAVLVVVAVSGLLWAPRMFGDGWGGLLAPLLTGVALFVVHATLGGAAAGRGDWTAYSALVGAEATVRLLLCAVAAAWGAHVVGLAWAVAAACGTWVVLSLASRRYRSLWGARADVDPRGLVRRMVTACTASGVSALLLVGYPVLLRATTPDAVYAGAAPIVLAVSLSRAPLLVPLGAYQNVVVSRVARVGLVALRPVVAVLALLTVLGAAGAWALGPWALRVVNPDYHVSGGVFGALVVAAGMVALLTVTGAAAVALDHHTVYLAGWLVATVVAVAVLLVPWSLEGRVVCSLLAGPAAGIAVHLALGRRRVG